MSALTAQRVIARLLERLKKCVPGARWDLQKTPEASWLNTHDRSQIIMARPVPEGVEIAMRDTEERRDQTLRFGVRNNEDIDRILPEIGPRAAWWADRLTLYRLQPDHVYTVVREFTDYDGRRFVPGDRLTFVKQDFARYDGYHVLTFREGLMTLSEIDSLMDNLDAYLKEA
jgi:hypothetical protein